VAQADAFCSVDPNRYADGRMADPLTAMRGRTSLQLQVSQWVYSAAATLKSIFLESPYESYDLIPEPGGCYPKANLLRGLLAQFDPPRAAITVTPQLIEQGHQILKKMQEENHPLNIRRVGLHPKVLERSGDLYNANKFDEAVLNAFKLLETEVRDRIDGKPEDLGTDLMSKAMNPKSPILQFSSVYGEQDGFHLLFRGAIALFKNPHSHRFVNIDDQLHAFELLTFASLLMHLLDKVKPVNAAVAP
jgi:uncharacterized protein (TIGR02391 family)